MGHVGVFTCDGVGLHLVAVLVLVPTALDTYLLLVTVEIRKAVQVNEHIVAVSRDIIAVTVDEVKHNIALLIQCLIVSPVMDDETEFSLIPQHIAGQLLAVLITRRVEIDEEVDDGGKEVLGGILEESL